MTSLRWMTPEDGGAETRRTARLTGRVAHSERVGSMYLLRLRVPGWRPADPGAFAMLHFAESTCFLPRAFSVYDEVAPAARPTATEADSHELSFLVSPVGVGTEELSNRELGDRIHVLGPVGRGFDLAEMAGRRLVIVAGGVGAAPFGLLLRRVSEMADPPAEVVALFGFRDEVQAQAHHLFSEQMEACRRAGSAVRTDLITEDGHLGRRGLVTELVAGEMRGGDRLAVCGAHAMCEAVWDICLEKGGGEADIRAWFSLEAGMACGIGSCQGCVIEVADGSLARVCRTGPVFPGEEAFGSRRHPCAVGEGGGSSSGAEGPGS